MRLITAEQNGALRLMADMDRTLIGKIPWVSDNARILEVDAFFSRTKELPREQHQLWKILKNAMIAVNNAFSSGGLSVTREVKDWVALDCVAKIGICDAIESMLFIAKEYPEELANVRTSLIPTIQPDKATVTM